MSCSIALRRSPKPGAFTAATLTMPRMVLTTVVAERFAFNVFSDDDQRFASFRYGFQNRQHFADVGDFLSASRMNGLSSSTAPVSGLLMKYGDR